MSNTSITLDIPAINVDVDLSQIERFGDGEDGRLIAISYLHEPYFPSQSGPVLHFQVPDGRVLVTMPNSDGYELCWEDSNESAHVDTETDQVVSLMWDQVDSLFQSVLAPEFAKAAVATLAKVLNRPDVRREAD